MDPTVTSGRMHDGCDIAYWPLLIGYFAYEFCDIDNVTPLWHIIAVIWYWKMYVT